MNLSLSLAAFLGTDIKKYLMDLGKAAKQKKGSIWLSDKENKTQIKLHLSNDRVNKDENGSSPLGN